MHINLNLLSTGLKCKECSYKCHRECEPKVPPSCGLPQELLILFADVSKYSLQKKIVAEFIIVDEVYVL